MNDIYDSHHEFDHALLALAASSWDIRILSTLWRASERYIRIGWGSLDPDPQEHARREQYHVELVAAFRQRDPEVAAARCSSTCRATSRPPCWPSAPAGHRIAPVS